jgi:predicted dehydrogenase/type 1 glutamine amidotransferase
MKKILFVHGGYDCHPGEPAARVLAQVAEADGRFTVESTTDLDAFLKLKTGEYAGVVVYTTLHRDGMENGRGEALMGFVKNGGGFMGIHSATDSFNNSKEYIDMIGGEFNGHPSFNDFKVTIVDKSHYITARMNDFTIPEEMYTLKNYDPKKVNVLMETTFKGQKMPMAYTKEYGKGRVFYLALGHDERPWNTSEFQKLLVRGMSWTTGANKADKKIRAGLLGYGPAFNMGKGHANWMNQIEGMEVVAMCDSVPARVEAAKEELPGLKGYFTDLDEMLKMKDLDLIVVILPHNIHAPMTLKCLEAGKHVVLEKPFCINTAEATAMIDLAKKKGVMLSVFHNRRWDMDYMTLKDIVKRGLIGDVFHIEARTGGYGHPGFWWRSEKAISGGVMYDWGAHFIDWILGLVPSKITQITGDFQKRVWDAVTNEDHGQAYIKFENGCVADFMTSSITAISGSTWKLLGTKGAIESANDGFHVVSYVTGIKQDSKIPFLDVKDAWSLYYSDVANHLLFGEDLNVKPEQARRTIGVMEAAELSAKKGTSVPPMPLSE